MKVGGKTYKVDIKYYDDESNPQTAARLVEKFVSEDHVNFILGPYGSANSATAAAVVERLKVPMVEGNGAAAEHLQPRLQVHVRRARAGHEVSEGILEMARTLKPAPKTVAIATANDAFSVEVGARRGRLRERARHDGRLQQQVSGRHDRRLGGRQRDQGGEPRHHPQRRPPRRSAAAAADVQGAERQREDLRLLGRPGYAGLPQDARQGRELRLRRHAVVADREVQGRARLHQRLAKCTRQRSTRSTATFPTTTTPSRRLRAWRSSTRSRKPARSIRRRSATRCRASTS